MIFSAIVFVIETDISVPSFPDMLQYFCTTECYVQTTLSINLFGFCLSGLAYGPLSDSFGRRNILIIGVFIFVLGSFGCTLASSIYHLIFFRFIQGVGASSGAIIITAMIADIYAEKKAANIMGIMNSVLTIFMAIAPLIGSVLVMSYGWKANFTLVAILSLATLFLVMFVMPETNKDSIVKFNFMNICKKYLSLLCNKKFMAYTSALSLDTGAFLMLVGNMPFIYTQTYNVGKLHYGFHMGAIIATFSIVSSLTGRFNQWLGMHKCLIAGALWFATFGFIMLVVDCFSLLNPILFTALNCFIGMGVALIFGNAGAISIYAGGKSKGVASSASMSIRFLVASLMVYISSVLYNGTFTPLVSIMFGCYVVAAISIFIGNRATN